MTWTTDTTPTVEDGTYSIDKFGELTDYAVKWDYGFIVAIENIVTSNLGRHPTLHEVRELVSNLAPEATLIGVWLDHEGGKCYIDEVKHVSTRAEAIELARENKELAIFDLYTKTVEYL